MTSAKLKHRVKLQEWAARIQDCRSSDLSVRAWCRQERINATTYYRWERELLALAETEPCLSVSAVRFAELPTPKQVSRNVAERSATLHIGNASLDIYPGCDTEQLKMLVKLLRLAAWHFPANISDSICSRHLRVRQIAADDHTIFSSGKLYVISFSSVNLNDRPTGCHGVVSKGN